MSRLRITSISIVALTTLLAACGQNQSDSKLNSLNIDAYIDSQIQGEERAAIRAHMSTLPPEDWQAITYIDFEQHKIYTNRVALQGLLSFAKKVPGTTNLYTTGAGRLFAAPSDPLAADGAHPLAVGTCAAGTSGPFRRVKTAAGTSAVPYGYAAATVTLGSTPTPGGGTPYAYVGATSSTNVESDVGLQYNTGANDWGAYIRSNGTTVTDNGVLRRYDASTSTNFEFVVVSDGIGRLRINKTSTSGGVPNPLVIDFSQPGLRKDGIGNLTKRITSIASPTTTANFSVQWTNMQVGLSTASNHAWGSFTNDTATDNCSYPSAKVTYTNVTGGEKVIVTN